MFKRLNYIKSVKRPLARVLHIKSPLQYSTPVERVASGAKVKTDVEIHREMPYVIDGQNYKYKEGRVYHGFLCERIEAIPDYGIMSCTLRHLGTGTEFWYLDRNHVENSFSIHIRTTPYNSTGLPHILEHLSLAGSERYPVRDPFFKMRNRTVATFMNALTGPDYTIYPFSSMNEVDFRNMQKVYMDGVFRPNLLYFDFLQEAWRLEHKDVHDRESDVVFKGVVYNEMLGVYADNNILFKQKLLNNILPSHAYGHMAAGNTLEMPNLTHEDLVNYHRQYYHPSNARIFCYGSFDLEKTLEFIDKEYLSQYDRIDTSFSRIPSEKRWSEPRRVSIQGRPDTMGPSLDRQNQIAIGVLLCDVQDIQKNFEFKILSELLIRGPNSPFYKSMIEPNFSGGFIRWSGHVPNRKDTYFTVGLQHVAEKDLELFENLFEKALQSASTIGFDSQHIESVLCNYELTLKQQSECKHLLLRSIVLWNHDGDVVSNLQISKMFTTLRNKLRENPHYFKEQIKKYLIDNSHKLTITMRPNELQEIERQLSESKLLLSKLEKTSDEEFEKIYDNGLKLKAFQKAPQNIDILPCISMSDVQKPFPRPQMEEITLRSVPTMISYEPLPGITYFNCMFNTTGLSLNDAMLLPLFCSVLSELGTSNHNDREFDNLVRSNMARISFTAKVVESVTDGESYRLGLLMKTYAFDKNVASMFRLCEELLLKFQMEDTNRLQMLIKNYLSKFTLNVRSNGHLYAMMGSSSLVTNAGRLKSLLLGVDHVDYMKKYVEENSIGAIRDSLKSIGAKVFGKNNLRVAINTSENNITNILGDYERFITHLPTLGETIDTKKLSLFEPSSRHYNLDMPLSFCAKTFFGVPYVHEDHAPLRVLAKMITANYLLPVVREENGAYGAGARIGFDGLFNFFSYRDPDSVKTMEVFDKTYEWLQTKSCKIDEQTVFEAKLAVLQLVDWPISPGEINSDSFVLGATYDIYFNYRARVLAVTIGDVQKVIEKYFKNESEHFGKCIIERKSEESEVEQSHEICC